MLSLHIQLHLPPPKVLSRLIATPALAPFILVYISARSLSFPWAPDLVERLGLLEFPLAETRAIMAEKMINWNFIFLLISFREDLLRLHNLGHQRIILYTARSEYWLWLAGIWNSDETRSDWSIPFLLVLILISHSYLASVSLLILLNYNCSDKCCFLPHTRNEASEAVRIAVEQPFGTRRGHWNL